MHHSSIRPAAAAVVACAVTMLAGCQRYQSKPLDLPGHEASWRSRAPGDQPVRKFAERLLESDEPAPAAFDPDDGVGLAEGEIVALVFNPDLRLARLRAGVAGAGAAQAGRWEDPELSVDVLRITQDVPSPWVVTPGLAFTIPISGRLEAERARADASRRAELDRVAEAEWRIRRDVRVAWCEWSAARLRVEEQRRLLETLSPLVDSTSRLAAAGEMLRTEAALFSLEDAQRRHELRRLHGAAEEAEQRLRALLGLAPDAPVALTPTLSIRHADPENAGEVTEKNPSLVRLRQEYEVAEETLRREMRERMPDLTLGPLFESDEGQPRIGFLGGVPLPIFNANRRAIAEAQAERELARAAYETAFERLVGGAAAARARAASLRAERDAILEDMVPRVDRQLDDARRLLELGESGGLVLLESLVRAHATKMRLIDVRLDEAKATAELAWLSGPTTPDAPDDNTPASPRNDEEATR